VCEIAFVSCDRSSSEFRFDEEFEDLPTKMVKSLVGKDVKDLNIHRYDIQIGNFLMSN
jgi:hypothetical protein